MGKRRLSGAVLAVVAVCTVAACAGGGTTSSFVPEGGSSPGNSGTAASSAPLHVPGLRTFAFPSSVQIEFQTPLPAGGAQRGAVIAYENYIDSMWYAAYKHGANTSYKRYINGNALSFAESVIGEFKSGYTLRGTIIYSNMSVPDVYFGNGALVESCVNASGLYQVNARTGKVVGTVLSNGYEYYQEQAAAGKRNGLWTIDHTEAYQANSNASAQVCAA